MAFEKLLQGMQKFFGLDLEGESWRDHVISAREQTNWRKLVGIQERALQELYGQQGWKTFQGVAEQFRLWDLENPKGLYLILDMVRKTSLWMLASFKDYFRLESYACALDLVLDTQIVKPADEVLPLILGAGPVGPLSGRETLERLGDAFQPLLNHLWAKEEKWQAFREQAQAKRPAESKTIEMKLYPFYFAMIQNGSKTFEGRAFKPGDWRYAMLRAGDKIRFRVDPEAPEEYREDTVGRNDSMVYRVEKVVFGPLVSSVFRRTGLGMCPAQLLTGGRFFQPDVAAGAYEFSLAEVLEQINRYYRIPGYLDRIAEHGFVGVEVKKELGAGLKK